MIKLMFRIADMFFLSPPSKLVFEPMFIYLFRYEWIQVGFLCILQLLCIGGFTSFLVVFSFLKHGNATHSQVL